MQIARSADRRIDKTFERKWKWEPLIRLAFAAAFCILSAFSAETAQALLTPTLSVSTSSTPSVYGDSITFTATISSGPTGSITFYDGSTPLGSSPISGTTAALTTSTLQPGNHAITAYYPGNSRYRSVTSSALTQTVNKITPLITWDPQGPPLYYGMPLPASEFNATSTVAGTFAYTPAVGTVLGAGWQVLSATFTPTDTAHYNTATPWVSIYVNQATPAITWPTPAPMSYLTAFDAQLNASSAVAGQFIYLWNGQTVGWTDQAGTVHPTGVYPYAGQQTLSATFTPFDTTDYTTATASVTVPVTKATVLVDWPTPSPITYGTPLDATQLSAVNTVTSGSFVYSPPAGTVLSAGSQTLSVTFTPDDTADYNTVTGSVNLLVNQATPVVTWPTPGPVMYGTALGSQQLNATASVPGTFAYTPPSGTVVPAGTDAISVVFTPTDTTDYTSVNRSVSLVVTSASLVLPPPGVIATIAGSRSQGYSGDGSSALAAAFNGPAGLAVDAAGNVYIADSQNNVIRRIQASSGVITTVAGNGTAGYSGDGGAATTAQLNGPTGIALDSAGNIYVADGLNNVVREINAITGIITTLAGTGTDGYSGDGGSATSAQLNDPVGVALDSAGDIYVADSQNSVVRKITIATGVISTVAGNSTEGNSGDGGPATSASLDMPTAVAVDSAGNVYIADTFNNRIRKVDSSTGIISAYAGQGPSGYSGDGLAAVHAELYYPTGLALDANGNLYIADIGNSAVREVSASTRYISTVAGSGTWGYSGDGGPATSAQLGIDQIDGLAIDASGNIYIGDFDNNVVRAVGATKSTPAVIVTVSPQVVSAGAQVIATGSVSSASGSVTFSNGQGWTSGAVPIASGAATASFSVAGWVAGTYSITVSYSGDALDNAATGTATLAVNSDTKTTPTIMWANPSPISYGTVLGAAQLNATASVPGTFVYSPAAGALLPKGTNALSVMFFPTDSADYNVASASVNLVVASIPWSLPTPGIISTVAGNGITGYSGDGGPATTAELTTYQSNIAVDFSGDIYFADWADNVVRKVTASTGAISTVAGNGKQGFSGDGGPAQGATLNGPTGVAVDALGNLYIADSGNNVVRRVSAQRGTIATVAGNDSVGYSGDGSAAIEAQLYFPVGVAVALNGDLYIADTGNNAIRKVTAATGQITTVAGTGTSGYTGDGSAATAATLNAPSGVAIDTSGNLYIADFSNNSIRVVYSTGTIPGMANPTAGSIYTLVGSASGAAISAALNGPQTVSIDASGNVYIADSGNNLVRAVYSSGTLPGIATPSSGTIYSLAGNGTPGYSGDAGSAANAQLNEPTGVAVDPNGNLYIVDSMNQVVRAVGAVGKQLPPTLSWSVPQAITYGNGLTTNQLGATESLPGTIIYEPSEGTVLTAGVQPLAATFVPNDTRDYSVATITTTITVNQATPVIIWPAPAPMLPGAVLGTTQLNATASVPGTFVYNPLAGTVLPNGTTTLSVAFTPADTVDYINASASVPVVVQPLTPSITWQVPASITFGTPLSATQLSATASVPGTFSYSPAPGIVLPAGTDTLTVTFTPTDTIHYTTATASVSLAVNQANPVLTWTTPTPIIAGTPLSASQLDATASVAGTFSYSPAAGTVLPQGTSTLTVTFTPTDSIDYASATAQVILAVNQSLAPGTPLLQLRTDPTPASVTLPNPVDLDWIVWGADGSTTAATRMSGGSLISDMTPLNAPSIMADSKGLVAYSWTGGTPTATGTNVAAEMTAGGASGGFQITAPADTTVKTLKLYVNINANAQLTASISDGSSPTVVHIPSSSSDGGNEIYSIDYRAASAGQTLTIQLIATDTSATIGLQAAVLEPHLPQVSILSPVVGQTFGSGGVPVILNASQFDTAISTVQMILNGTPGTTLSSAPYTTTLTLSPGHYKLQAQATDRAGLANTSSPVEFDVASTGGSLTDSFSVLDTNAVVDLTTEGNEDWTFFAPSTQTGTQINRKAGVVPLISQYSVVSTAPTFPQTSVWGYGNFSFSFEDGTPDPVESAVTSDVDIRGNQSIQVQITAPADTTPRTLRLYVEGCACNVQMNAFLSDGSAPPITDNSLNTTYVNWDNEPFYSIQYSTGSPGQTLTVRLSVPAGGHIHLDAASLSGIAPAVPAVPVVTSLSPSSGTAGTRVTVSGNGFGEAQGSSTVTFNGASATVISWTDSEIIAAVPSGVQTGSVQVVTAGGSSNTDVSFTLAPTLTSISPAVGPVGSAVTITGSGFGSSQGNGSVSFNGTPASPSTWSDSQIVVAVPAGATTGSVVVTQGAPAAATPLFTVTSGPLNSQPSVLKVRFDNSPAFVNLSDPNNQDWVAWGANHTYSNTVRMSGANLINVTSPLTGYYLQAWWSQVEFSWNNGSPTTSATNALLGIESAPWWQQATSGNNSIQLTAPADTTVRTLKIYSVETGLCQVSASLSDGSSTPVTFAPGDTYDYGEKVYSIDYRAGSPGQTLTVTISIPAGLPSDNAYLVLEAATLQPFVPQVSIESPTSGMMVPSGTAIPLGADALQYDSAISGVTFSANQSQISSLQAPPYTTTWTPSPGHYLLEAQATDTSGRVGVSAPVHMDVIGSGGTLTQTHDDPPTTPVDLTSIGTADWVMFQNCADESYPSFTNFSPNMTRKAGVAPLISAYKVVGDQQLAGPEGDAFDVLPLSFAYRDGTPDNYETAANCDISAWNGAPGVGFEFTVAADTNPRTLSVYVGTDGAPGTGGKLTAYLSDGSAPVVSDTSLVNPQMSDFGFAALAYHVTFKAASPGQKLTVRWILNSVPADVADNYSFGEAQLYAAALSGPPVPSTTTGPSITNITPATGIVGTTVTLTGSGFGATQGSSGVTFNGVSATPSAWSDTQIQVPAPAADNPGNVVVTVNGLASDPVIFNMPATITSLSTDTAAVGAKVTISGGNFGSSGSAALGGPGWSVNATVTNWTDSQIQITIPSIPSYICSGNSCSAQLSVSSNSSGSSNSISFTVLQNPIASLLQWSAPSPISYGTPLSATQLNATASVPGTFTYSPAAGSILQAGVQTLTVTFTPTDNVTYTTATTTVVLTVNQAVPTVSWTTPAPIAYGTALTAAQLDATASVPGALFYNPGAGATPVAGTDNLTVTFSPSDSRDYQTVRAYVTLTVNPGKQGIEVPPPGVIEVIAGTGTSGYSGDGAQATNAQLNTPYGVAVDSSGNVYIADTNNHAIREINVATGVITTVAGNGISGYSGDGGPAINAQLNSPYGVAVDASGNVYIADTGNNAIRVLTSSSGLISTLAGDGSGRAGYIGDGGPATAAEFNEPTDVAADSSGNIYIADWLNSAVREVNASTGVIRTVAGDGTGVGGYSGDGGSASTAKLNKPFGVALDGNGDLFIADTYNNRVREVAAGTGIISTVIGNGTAGFSGDNGVATAAAINTPIGIAVDTSGNIYVSDWFDNVIRGVNANDNVITTVAGGGGGASASTGASGLATDATLNAPGGLGIDPAGNLYFPNSGPGTLNLEGQPTPSTPIFNVPPGMYLAWQYPGGPFPQLPPGAQIQQQVPVGNFVAVLYTVATDDGPGGFPQPVPPTYGGGGISSGGGNNNNPPPSGQLYLVNPYTVLAGAATSNPTLLSTTAVVNDVALAPAKGIVADGTSTAIAVYATNTRTDVTFYADNGSSLAPYDPAFLNEPPAPVSSSSQSGISLVVPAASLVSTGDGNYYALALLQAPTPSTAGATIGGPIHVWAAGAVTTPQSSLTTLPVPVVLVHGIWGDKSSLSSTRAYLQGLAQYKSSPLANYMVTPICYSKTLGFDSPPGSVALSAPDCEHTAIDQVQSYLAQMYNTLDENGIVGGRFDVVAHSMGGLVIRYYVTQTSTMNEGATPYKSIRNRNQGTFRDIITLDTPEEGSQLADALDNTYYSQTLHAPVGSIPDEVWHDVCIDPTVTIFTCFYRRGMPLAPSVSQLSNGSVASLRFDSSHITSLVDPNIPNATWFAIDSYFPDNGDPESALRFLLNSLIGATFTDPNTAPTLTQMMGGDLNDVIVTTDSQLYNSRVSKTFEGLSHTSLPGGWFGAGSQFVWKYSGKINKQLLSGSVTNNDAVNYQIADWLMHGTGTGTGSSQARIAGMQSGGLADSGEDVDDHPQAEAAFSAPGRVAISPPVGDVRLAHPVQVVVDVGERPVLNIFVTQRGTDGYIKNRHGSEEIGDIRARIVRDEGQTKVIEVTPVGIGAITAEITVQYADGGWSERTIALNVSPSADGVERFRLNDLPNIPVVLEDGRADPVVWLAPSVKYGNMDYSTYLPDCSYLKMTVLQSPDDPVIRLDSNGLVHGIRPGTAIIVASYDGLKDRVIITVYNKDKAPPEYRSTVSERSQARQ